MTWVGLVEEEEFWSENLYNGAFWGLITRILVGKPIKSSFLGVNYLYIDDTSRFRYSWGVMLFVLLGKYRRFEGIWCLYLNFHPEDGG